MKFKTAGVANQDGDNIIDRATSGMGGITNEPAFPNNNATQPSGQGASHDWAGVIPADDGAGGAGGVSQYYHAAGGEDRNMSPDGEPPQDYAKPTDGSRAHTLGPGMSQ